MKIHITGNAGSGKTTLSKRLSKRIKLPSYGLDKVVWKENWMKTDSNERAIEEKKLVQKSEWVIEGVSKEIRRAADFVIFIDRNPFHCVIRALIRSIPFLTKSRPELPNNCPELKIIPYTIKLIFHFNRNARKTILDDITSKPHKILRTDREIKVFLETVSKSKEQLFLQTKGQKK